VSLQHTFEVWAPYADAVSVTCDGVEHAMSPASRDWWRATVRAVTPEPSYAFRLDSSDQLLPDPRSQWQPEGVRGASRLVDHASFPWTDATWTSRPLAGAVVYEIHIGTFTPGGTLDSAVERLDHLAGLGVDFVELMPVNAFDGLYGWGYDGVCWYATHEEYGGPYALKRFVDACHARGIGVLLDVVYNHLGPTGSVLHHFAPYQSDHGTDWGPAINLDGADSDEVRRYIVDNAVTWLRDYHLDGLRLDATDALLDRRATHLLEEIGLAVRRLQAHLGRSLVLIAESDLNDPRVIAPREAGGHGIDAQWSDDFHHALHAALTGEHHGYYADFGGLSPLAQALTNGFVLDGRVSVYRGRHHGRPIDTTRTPGWRLLGYAQNHDQVGNRPRGDRLASRVGSARAKIAAALTLTGPSTPMLFMGEEWAAGTPFPFFSSFTDPVLAQQVREGRRREFAAAGVAADDMYDPQDPATREAARLDWAETARSGHLEVLDWYRRLIALRREHCDLTDPVLTSTSVRLDDAHGWLVLTRGTIAVACNISASHRVVPVPGAGLGEVLLSSGAEADIRKDSLDLPPESVVILRLVDPERP